MSIEVFRNQFPQKDLKTILDIAKSLDWTSPKDISKLVYIVAALPSQTPYLWVACRDPIFFLQHQIDSVTALKKNKLVLLVWRPKYLEYPSAYPLTKMNPALTADSLDHIKLNLTSTSLPKDTAEIVAGKLQSLCEAIWSESAATQKVQVFEVVGTPTQRLVTEAKHLVSRFTKLSFWHCIMGGEVQIPQQAKQHYIEFSLVRRQYRKQLWLFSFKGEYESIDRILLRKWKQVIGFVSMFVVFLAIVVCDGNAESGVCAYRQDMAMGGAMILLFLGGVRLAGKTKKKKTK